MEEDGEKVTVKATKKRTNGKMVAAKGESV